MNALSLPLLTKELTEIAARRRTYITRVVYALLLFGFFVGINESSLRQASSNPLYAMGTGQNMFAVLIVLQIVGICLFLPAFTAGLITQEKERDSLEKELRALTVRLDQAEKKPAPASDLSEKISATLNETRRLASVVEKLQGRLPREDRPGAAAGALARVAEEVRREIQDLRKQTGADQSRITKLFEEAAARSNEAARAQGEAAQLEVQRRGSLERVGVFVDVQNMFYAARGQNARLDFDVLLQTTTRGRRLIRAVAYVVEAKEIDQSGFIALLQQKRYEVKRKDLKVRSDGSFKGDWDMEIALDALEMADAVDVVVLVTGDGDFTSLVQKLKIRGPRVEVYSFPQNTAKELREAADKFVSIDKRMLIKTTRLMPRQSPTGTAGS